MKKFLPFIIVGIILLTGGMFLLSNSQTGSTKDEKTEHMVTAEKGDKPVDQSHRSYEIEVTQKAKADEIALNKPTTLKYKIKNDRGEVVKDFAVAHEKLMHLIIIRKDLTQFQHLHPEFNESTGEFSTDVIFTVGGPYRFFADFTPGEENNPMQLPVTVEDDIDVGDVSKFQAHSLTPDAKKEKTVPPSYQVSYNIPNPIKSQEMVNFSLDIQSNGQPVTLEKYLGALGHTVILKKDSLDYIHTHAGDAEAMDGMGHEGHSTTTEQEPNIINFSTAFPEPGIYKIFTQFQHNNKVLTSEYTVEVK